MRTLYSRITKWFPIPRVIEMYYAAIHISSNNMVTYLEMKRDGESLLPFVNERVSFKRQSEDDTTDLVRVLTSLKKKYKVPFIKATIVESKSYLFESEVPKLKEDDLYEAVAFSIEEKAPVSLADVVFGFRVTDESNPESNTVSVGVVPEKVVRDSIEVFNQAGFRPLSMKVEAQAVANAVVPKDSPHNYIVVSIKDNKTVIAIVQNGGVFLSATVDFGGEVFDTILLKHYPDMSPAERVKLKKTEQFLADGAYKDVHMEFLEQAALLKNYLNKYYIYWLTHKATAEGGSSKSLAAFIIVGDEVSIPGLVEYLNAQLKVRVEAGNVWVNCFNIAQYVPEIPYDESFQYAEAMGLLIGKD